CDWSGVATCDVAAPLLPLGLNTFVLRTRCQGNLPTCETSDSTTVDVGRDVNNVQLAWPSGAIVSGYRIFRDGDPELPMTTRVMLSQVLPSITQLNDL